MRKTKQKERMMRMNKYHKTEQKDSGLKLGGGMAGVGYKCSSQTCNEVRRGWTFCRSSDSNPPVSVFTG